jgi:UDP-N-acetylglucosamine transferase subunit ALG13
MILVTVGASSFPFDRLVGAVESLPADGETIVVQYGTAHARPSNALCFDYVAFADLQEWVSESRLVICHAGIGSVAMCLSIGLHPIVVPRRKRLRECIDEHQLAFGHRLAELGLATVIEDVSSLPKAVRYTPSRQPRTGLSRSLAEDLISFIDRHATTSDRSSGVPSD